MRATSFEFRFRMWTMIAALFLGFWAPWSGLLGVDRGADALGWMVFALTQAAHLSPHSAGLLVVCVGLAFASLGAWLRVWGAAYLGYATIHDKDLQGGTMMADGPYRFLRNPLYLGGWFMTVALCLLMPVAGAPVALLLMTLIFLRLILAEEYYLSEKLGGPYCVYLEAVPRLFPCPGRVLPPAGHKPNWQVAILSEINPIGVVAAFAIFGWSYNITRMLQTILVSFGLAMIARAIFMKNKPTISTEA